MNNESLVSVNYSEEIEIIDKLKNSTTFQEFSQNLLSSGSSIYIEADVEEKAWKRLAIDQVLREDYEGDAIYDKLYGHLSKRRNSTS